MSKEDKNMGISKPKYDPKKAKPREVRSSKKKPFMLMIYAREPTEQESADYEKQRTELGRWWPIWMCPWSECKINKYASLKSAQTARAAYMKKKETWWFKYHEMERSIILNTTTGKECDTK